MGQVVRLPIRLPAIHCPRCPRATDGETCPRHAAGLMQVGDARYAERALRVALLSAQGAELVLGPLEGISALIAAGRLLFRRKSLLATGDVTRQIVGPSLFCGYGKQFTEGRFCVMVRYLSTGTATIVALMAAHRLAQNQARGSCRLGEYFGQEAARIDCCPDAPGELGVYDDQAAKRREVSSRPVIADG